MAYDGQQTTHTKTFFAAFLLIDSLKFNFSESTGAKWKQMHLSFSCSNNPIKRFSVSEKIELSFVYYVSLLIALFEKLEIIKNKNNDNKMGGKWFNLDFKEMEKGVHRDMEPFCSSFSIVSLLNLKDINWSGV